MNGRRAIVVGAGIAGTLAARALAEAFDEVLLLERVIDLDAGRSRTRPCPRVRMPTS